MYYRKILLFIASLCSFNFVVASDSLLDNASLWLPKLYQPYLDDLTSAAVEVKETEKCYRLLSGKLIEGRSNPDHLIFSFRCRTQERYSFSVEFDNNTRLISDPYDPLILKQEEDRLRKERERVKAYKEICQQEMKKRMEDFKQATIVNANKSDSPFVKDGITTYTLSFNSLSSKNKVLFYKVACKVMSDSDDYQIKVSPRVEVMPTKK